MYRVLGHELNHLAEKAGKRFYNAHVNAIARIFYGSDVNVNQAISNLEKNNGVPTSRLEADIVRRKHDYDSQLGTKHDYKYIAEEVMADRMGDILFRSDDTKRQELVDRLVADDIGTARRLLDSLKSALKKAIGMKGAWQTNAQKSVDMLARAIDRANTNSQTSTDKEGRYRVIEYLTNEILDDKEYSGLKDQWNAYTVGALKNPIERKNGGIVVATGDSVIYTNSSGNAELVIRAKQKDLDVRNSVVQDALEFARKESNFGNQYRVLTSMYGEKDTVFGVARSSKRYLGQIARGAGLNTRIKSERVLSEISDERLSLPITDSNGNEVATELPGGTVALDEDRYSLSSFNGKERDAVRQALYNAKDEDGNPRFTRQEVDKFVYDAMGVAAKIAQDRHRLDFDVTDPEKSMFKSNSDYGGSIDASTLCAKRLLYQGTFDAIQHLMPDTVFMPEDLIRLSNMMREMGYETPCGICYVESRRRNLDKFAGEWLENYHGDYIPKLDEVTTSDGLEILRVNHRQTYDDFIQAMKSLNQRNPKVVQLRTEYRGEIRDLSDKQIQKYINHGGIRLQSFSDFETPHLLDMMQVVMDIASKGLTSQAYTKVPNFAWAFGDTGVKINLSLIGKGEGVDENGNLIFDDVEGMPYEEAMKLRNRYSKNVGTILVGINDKQILAAMADPTIDYIIPFHRSGWTKNDLRLMPTIEKYKDYTLTQNERDAKTGKKVDKNLEPVGEKTERGDGYWDFTKSGKENAEKYLDLCYKNGIIPKFDQFLDKDKKGHYHLKADGSTDGYWKTLIDFKMYDNDGNGSPQTAVTPNVNMNEAYRILKEYRLERKQPGKNTPAVPMADNNSLPEATPVVERFKEEYESSHPMNAAAFYPTMGLSNTESEYVEPTEEQKVMYADDESRFSLPVTDPETLDFLNKQEEEGNVTTTYRTMKLLDGKLVSPKASFINGKVEGDTQLGQWEEATEHPELIKFDENGKPYFELEEKGRKTKARYNPYMHSSNLMLNDQFTGAYQYSGDNKGLGKFVTVECIVPNSEAKSGYQAQYAKDPVGWTGWKAGGVAQELEKAGKAKRDVFLSRWIKPVRIVPDSEVAKHYKQLLDGTNIEVPANVVTPSLLNELEKAGVKIGPPTPQQAKKYRETSGNRYSLPSDAPYLSAVDHGDMETAQRMVDEKAQEAGYTLVGYHGTKMPTLRYDTEGFGSETDYENKRLPFTIFKAGLSGGIYMASNREVSEGFASRFDKQPGTVMSLYVKFDNPLVVNEHVYSSVPRYYNIPTPSVMKEAGYTQETLSTEEISQFAQENG